MSDIERLISNEYFSDLFASVTEQTFPRPGSQVRRSVRVTVEAGDFFHAGAVDFLTLMAFQAEPWLGSKFVRDISVTFCTFNLLHKNMFGMQPRFIDQFGIIMFFILLPMALDTVFPGYNDLSVSFRNGLRPVQDKINQKPVLLRYRQVMTVVAVYFLVFTRFPGVECRLHQMATHAELRIVLCEIIKLE
jgi:hypothetical protein